MNQTWKNDKKPNFGPNFGPNLGPQTVLAGFASNGSYKLFQAIVRCNLKEN